ncbi:MAG TPA: site-2 protease family protein [Gemmatimonadota bacterium]|nr:site-2 protease family protein [Gemmatimonadota bacterium]
MGWKFWKRAKLVPELSLDELLRDHPAESVAVDYLEDPRVFRIGREKILRGNLRYDSPAERARISAALRPLDVSHYFERVNGGTLVTVTHPEPPAVPPEWRWNLAGFVLTVLSTLWAGAFLEGAPADFFLRDPGRVWEGVPFSAALMGILAAHEFGHYFAARRYGLHVTLPFFIPMPILSPIGTLGAVIKMKTPIYTRRMLLDVGAAGPLAGIVIAIPVAAWGILGSAVLPAETMGGIRLGEPLLFKGLVALFAPSYPETHDLYLNSLAFAGWIGLFVTALNMLPIGQLDGGHVLYALVGRVQHRVAWLSFAALLVMGWWWPGWYLWAVLVLFLIRIKHPPVLDPEIDLGYGRRWVGWLAVAVFILCFVPVPFEMI